MTKQYRSEMESGPKISRRLVLRNGILVASSVAAGLWKPAAAQTAPTIDFYIGPNGSDSNPGTASSPWAITALNTKRSTYAGKTVGFLDGTYDVSGIAPNRAFEQPIFNISGGSAGSPTIIKSVNPRRAHITAKASNGDYTGMNGSGACEGGIFGHIPGSGVASGNIVFDGLKMSGTKDCLIRIGVLPDSTNVNYIRGAIVQNCELFDTNAVGTQPGQNYCAITLHANDGTIIRNNYIHDIVSVFGTTSADHVSGTIQWGCINMIYEYNTYIRCGYGPYAKEGFGNGQYGAIIRYNYMDCRGYGSSGSGGIVDFAGDNSTVAPSDSVLLIHNNVIIAGTPLKLRSVFGWSQRTQTKTIDIHNNTLIIDTAVGMAGGIGIMFQSYNPGARIYNNVFWGDNDLSVATAFYEFGYCVISNGPHQVFDYNAYPNNYAKWTRFSNGQSPYDTGAATSSSSLTAWRTSLAAVGSAPAEARETNSFQITNPMFVGTGTNADKYKLQSGSPLRNAGRVGGTSSGAAVDVGAWAGATRIGHYFGLTPMNPSAQPVT